MTGENNQNRHTPRPIGDDSPPPDVISQTLRLIYAKINQKTSERMNEQSGKNMENSTTIQDSPKAENLIKLRGMK